MWKKTVLRGLEPYVPTSTEYRTTASPGTAPAAGNGRDAPAYPAAPTLLSMPALQVAGDAERSAGAAPDETPASGPAVSAEPDPGNPEEQPGSASEDQLTSLHIILGGLGFGTADREQKLKIAETITGRALLGPAEGRSSKNLSFTEARKLIDTLDGMSRDDLIAKMAAREQEGDGDG